MLIKMAHVRERGVSGGWIDYAVFAARSNSGTDSDNSSVLADLTGRARAAGLKIDQAALVFKEMGRNTYYGTSTLVDHLAKHGVNRWTHTLTV